MEGVALGDPLLTESGTIGGGEDEGVEVEKELKLGDGDKGIGGEDDVVEVL